MDLLLLFSDFDQFGFKTASDVATLVALFDILAAVIYFFAFANTYFHFYLAVFKI